jgi:hypothetical protein
MADAKSAKIAILYEKNIAIITAPWPVHSFQGADSEDKYLVDRWVGV